MEIGYIYLPSVMMVFLSSIVLQSESSPWGLTHLQGENPQVMELPVCDNTLAVKPCKILMFSPDVPEAEIVSQSRADPPLCTCAGDLACPTTWNEDPDRTLSFYLNVGGRNTAVQYKFCERLSAEHECGENDVSASLTGTGILPVELRSSNCKCPSQNPLYLFGSTSSGFRRTQHYGCSMPVCPINRSEPPSCVTLTKQEGFRSELWQYSCQCPDGHRCMIDPTAQRAASVNQPVSGYCRRL